MKKVKYDVNTAQLVFKGSKNTGIQGFQPFKHKNGNPYSDVDYMYALGKHVNELETKSQPVFYDKTCVAVAKEIVRGRDELGQSDKELHGYLLSCLDLSGF